MDNFEEKYERNECDMEECPLPTLDDYNEPVGNEDIPMIGVFIDLTRFTDKATTRNLKVMVNHRNSEIYVSFNDIRDYDIFVTLMKEYEDMKRNPFKRFLKNRKSIFMSVMTRKNEKVGVNYEYKFSGCSIKSVNGTEYSAFWGDMAPFDRYSCCVTFKYKKLKVVDIKWHNLSGKNQAEQE